MKKIFLILCLFILSSGCSFAKDFAVNTNLVVKHATAPVFHQNPPPKYVYGSIYPQKHFKPVLPPPPPAHSLLPRPYDRYHCRSHKIIRPVVYNSWHTPWRHPKGSLIQINIL